MLYDAQRRKYWLVPHSLMDFVQQVNGKELAIQLRGLEESQRLIAKEYIDFLIENDLALYADSAEELDCFPELSLEWDNPHVIANSIIDIKDYKALPVILNAIGACYIPCLQIVLLDDCIDLAVLEDIIIAFQKVQHKTLQILFDNKSNIQLQELTTLCSKYSDIEFITAFNSPEESYLNEHGTILVLTQQKNFTNTACGIIGSEYFNLLLPHFTESLTHNTCLNRKISIDVDGNIKNCPSMQESFGNIKDTTLEEAINKPGFKRYWNITKDQVTKCKDCEFRHVCTDCRAYTDNPEDIFSTPLKCGYDPYTCTWEEWSVNPLKQQAIDYYSMQEL